MELESPAMAPLLEQNKTRRRLYGKLCRLGVFLRFLTFLNGVSLLGAAGYSLYVAGYKELSAPIPLTLSADLEDRVRLGIEYALMAGSGLFLLALEHASANDEANARSSLGLAYGGSGRFLMFLLLALISTPAIHTQRTLYEMYATGGAVAGLLVSALLQAWFLSCAPEYRSHVVAELDAPKILVDSSAFPQVYQRDEGQHLRMGVLLPGFSSRETCTLAANVSALTLAGTIDQLEAPYSNVDASSTSGPFGPFKREVQLAHPVDVSVPVESRMGLGILEFRFQKGPF